MLGAGLLQRGIGLGLIMILSRVLGPAGLGAFTFVQSTSSTFANIARLGIDAGSHVVLAGLKLPEEKVRAEAVIGQTLGMTLSLGVFTAVAMVGLASPIAERLFDSPGLEMFVVASAIVLVAQMLIQYCYTVFAGLHAFHRYSRIMAVSLLISAGMALAGAFWSGSWGCVVGFTMGQAINLVLLATGLRIEARSRGLRLRLALPGHESYRLLSIGLPFYLSNFLLLPTEFLALGLLTRSAGLDALGELRVVQSLMSVASTLAVALAGPRMSHLSAFDASERNPEPLLIQLKLSWILSLLVVIPLGAVWPWAIGFIFGNGYTEASQIGSLALTAFVPTLLTGAMVSALLVQRLARVLLVSGVAQAAGFALVAWILIPSYGLGGLLIAQAVGFAIAAAVLGVSLAIYYSRSIFRPWMIPLLALTASFLAFLAGLNGLDPNWVVRLMVSSAFLILALVVFYSSLSPSERSALINGRLVVVATVRRVARRILIAWPRSMR